MWGEIAGNVAGTLLQNSANRRQDERNRGFQERMSNSAHQREVADLRAAGLNPILSANAGASTPSGGQSQMENALSPAVNSAIDARRLQREIKQSDSEISKNTATEAASYATALQSISTAKNVDLQSEALAYGMPAAKIKGEWDEKFGTYDAVGGRVKGAIDTLLNLRGNSAKMPSKIDVPKNPHKFKSLPKGM